MRDYPGLVIAWCVLLAVLSLGMAGLCWRYVNEYEDCRARADEMCSEMSPLDCLAIRKLECWRWE